VVSWLAFGGFVEGLLEGAGRGKNLAKGASDDQAVEHRVALALLQRRVTGLLGGT